MGLNSTGRSNTVLKIPLERIHDITTIEGARNPDRDEMNYSLISESSIFFGSAEDGEIANSSIPPAIGSKTAEALKNITL